MKSGIFVIILSMSLLLWAIDFIQGKPIRKLSPDKEYWAKFENYLTDKKWPENEIYENYIILYYEQSVEYSSGFANEYRKEISHIINGEDNKTATDSLSIAADTKIEIYFSSPLTSLESFFDRTLDDKMEYLKSVDLSHLDATQITSFENLFYECLALKSVTPTKVPTLSLTTMSSMFEGCISILAIDLSKYYTSLVTNLDFLFYGCKSLKAIDLLGNNFDKVESIISMFEGLNNLSRLNINFGALNMAVFYNTIMSLLPIVGGGICPSSCCEIDLETGECIIEVNSNYSSYITVTYGRDSENLDFIDRNTYISHLRIGETLKSVKKGLEIKNGTKIDIFFSSAISSINELFYGNEDIISVDFSNFDSSQITQIYELFRSCSSLKAVDLTSFKSLQINNLRGLFKRCKELTSVNISHISNISINQVLECFEECSSLKILDISGLNFSATEENAFKSFDGVINLKYINIIGSSFSQSFLAKIPKMHLIVCQDENNKEITDGNIINKCCDLNEDFEKCYSFNFIVAYYTSDSTIEDFPLNLNTGIKFNDLNNNYLEEINSLVLDDVYLSHNESILISAGSIMEIYFSSPLNTLDHFFDSENINIASKYIISIDLTHFDYSNLNSINYLFKGCERLKSVDFPNFKEISGMEGLFQNCESSIA